MKILRGIGRALAWFDRSFNSSYDAAHPLQKRQLEQIEDAQREAAGPGGREAGERSKSVSSGVIPEHWP